VTAVVEPGQADEPGAPSTEAPAAVEPVIAVRGLTRRFGDFVAVDHLDLDLAPGELFGLLGPNGAGKSTTIKMLATLLSPSDGDAIVAGASVRREPAAVRERIGYVPQAVSADAALTGRDNLWLSGRLYRVPRSSLGASIDRALGFMDLTDAADRQVRTYSGGMVRRLELAMAMLHRPIVLFLDEPTVGLDPTARSTLWTHIERLREATGMTVLLTTHYMEEAEVLCDRVAIMHRGVIAAIGDPDMLRAQVGPDATLDDVFGHFTGAGLETGGSFRDLVRTRRTARRLG
jgi:ABC-2 type transport system ATP-binding protein